MAVEKPKVKWLALYPPAREGGRWFFNIATADAVACGELTETPSDAPAAVAMEDLRRLLRNEFDAPPEFKFEPGPKSWGATFSQH